MGHLVTEHGKLVNGHSALVSAVHRLVGNEACCRDHVRGHSISNEEQHILGLAGLLNVPNVPVSSGGGSVVVMKRDHIVAWLIESYSSPGLRRYVHMRRSVCIGSKQISAQVVQLQAQLITPFPPTYSYQPKSQVSSSGSSMSKYELTSSAAAPALLMVRLKPVSGTPLYWFFSDPMAGKASADGRYTAKVPIAYRSLERELQL